MSFLLAIFAALGCGPKESFEHGAFSLTSSAISDTAYGRLAVGRVSPMSGTGYEIIFQVGGDSSAAGVLEGGIFTVTTAMPFHSSMYRDSPGRVTVEGTPFEVRMGFPGFLPAFDVDMGAMMIEKSDDSTIGYFRFDCSTCADSAKPALWFEGRFSYRSRH